MLNNPNIALVLNHLVNGTWSEPKKVSQIFLLVDFQEVAKGHLYIHKMECSYILSM